MQIEIFKAALACVLMCTLPTLGAREPAPASNEPLAATLGALEKQSWVAWKARDAHFFESFLTANHVEIGPGGLANKAAVVASVGSPVCTVAGYSLGDFKFTQIGADTAVLNYRAEQQTMCAGVAVPSPVWATSVYVKRDGKWRNAIYQQTPASGH